MTESRRRRPRVAVTRARGQADELGERLEAAGFEVVHHPTIRIAESPDPVALEAAARRVGDFEWVVFTSRNGVRAFDAAMAGNGAEFAVALVGVRVACVGPGTAEAVRSLGRAPDLVPEKEYMAEGLVEAFAGAGLARGTRILVPQAERARATLRMGLEMLGLAVTTVMAYRTLPDEDGIASLRKELVAGTVDVVAFSSPSTIEFFVERCGTDVGKARVAVIGPIAAAAARRVGLPVHAEAGIHTAAGLADAVVAAIGADVVGRGLRTSGRTMGDGAA